MACIGTVLCTLSCHLTLKLVVDEPCQVASLKDKFAHCVTSTGACTAVMLAIAAQGP